MTEGRILITGAAGYIGSHTVRVFSNAGFKVISVDDLSTGSRALVPDEVEFVEADVADMLARRWRGGRVDGFSPPSMMAARDLRPLWRNW